MSVINDGLFLPALMLAALGFVVPRMLARFLPEGVRPLLLNAFMSTIVLFFISAVFFFCLYLLQGLSPTQIFEPGLAATLLFFGRLGLSAAIIWAPIMLLSVAGLPRKWVSETW
ncbi:hypothetical protein [Yoonia sp.]|uniref:hypothetical protein n=1 Tax=Yoonia sp. TaxID=2212373 RepID=UPI003F6B1304